MKHTLELVANLDRTAESLKTGPDAIRLGHFVESVEWSEGCTRVHFRTDDVSDALEADAVVVTIPLGALHHNLIAFKPELPMDLRDGLTKFSYGALGKVFFEFGDVFWSKENDQVCLSVTAAVRRRPCSRVHIPAKSIVAIS